MESIQQVVFQQLQAVASQQFNSIEFQSIPIIVGYSGGLDSSVLLHACHQLQQQHQFNQLSAVHINHGLQSQNDAWQQHCEESCLNYAIQLHRKKFNLAEQGDKSENAARQARYQVFSELLNTPKILLLAHHLDDQVETMLFRMIRGTGVHGLSGIPQTRALANGWIARPLLHSSREQLQRYAQKHQLDWVEDPSNLKSDYSRNYLRNQVLPSIQSKWPQYSHSFQQLSELALDQVQILDEVAEQDLNNIKQVTQGLCLEGFNQLSTPRRKNLLHFWVKLISGRSPSSGEINQAIMQLQQSSSHSIKIRLASGWLRCYQKQLYFCAHDEPSKLSESSIWEDFNQLKSLENGVSLVFKSIFVEENQSTLSIRPPQQGEVVSVRARSGGEIAKPVGRRHQTELKKIFQERAVPTWQREWLPLIYYGDKLAAVPGVFVDQAFAAEQAGFRIELQVSSE
jgi:tRNA(Ile)-lysidine synthase